VDPDDTTAVVTVDYFGCHYQYFKIARAGSETSFSEPGVGCSSICFVVGTQGMSLSQQHAAGSTSAAGRRHLVLCRCGSTPADRPSIYQC